MRRLVTTAAVMALLVAYFSGSPARADDQDKEEIKRLKERITRLEALVEEQGKIADEESRRYLDAYKRLDRRVSRLESRTESTSRRFDSSDNAGYGSIQLTNELGVPATVTIANQSYYLRPYGSRTLYNQPAGQVSYSVTAEGYGVTSRRTTLYANDTLTLTVTRPYTR